MRHFYVRDQQGNPKGCVVLSKDEKGIRISVSKQSPRDNFDRVRGREIAIGRQTKVRTENSEGSACSFPQVYTMEELENLSIDDIFYHFGLTLSRDVKNNGKNTKTLRILARSVESKG